ncbi:hypothetical protein [Pedobacter faecalis]|uniref:hypothetical protein n=1 Tax=Pedobacter faecalis TaxID=3041495 RepID=UPI00254DC564|nr:hypothetical protein [Pedobacter sp. ELA7]
MKRIFVLLLMALSGCGVNAVEESETLAKSFLADVQNKEITIADVAAKHLCALDEKDQKQLAYLQLEALRGELAGKKTVVLPLAEVPEDESTILSQPNGHVYRISADGVSPVFLLVESDKISSFSVMRKGSEDSTGVFLKLCN